MNSEVLSKPRSSLYADVTAKIVRAIEEGAGSYQMPWHRTGVMIGRPINALTGRAYQGVNVVSLWVEAASRRSESPYWATYRQWQELGAHVRQGERGTTIVFYSPRANAEDDDTRDDGSRSAQRFVARASRVFNAVQVDGWTSVGPFHADEDELVPTAEALVELSGARIAFGSSNACYHPSGDYIEMPSREAFVATASSSAGEAFYAVLLHELTHWTGHPARLNRDLTGRFGSGSYAMEELVAELGAAFLCADLRVSNEPRRDHAQYLESWLKVLRQDSRALFSAATHASHAATYLVGVAS